MSDKTLILHDYFETPDGGGRLCNVLARCLEADLACGFMTPGHPYFVGQELRGRIIELGRFPKVPLLRQFLLARAFMNRTELTGDYDAAIYSGSYAPLAVLHRPARRNILYCHTPPRFLYDRKAHFLALAPAPLRPLLQAFRAWLRPHYEEAVSRMDVLVANSHNVRDRVRRYLGREAEVVYPPVDVGRHAWRGQEGFYLSAARLDPLKRVDVVVAAFAQMPEARLVVASDGPDGPRIRRLASGHANIELLGPVDEGTLARLLGTCIATVYVPRDEDFGMSPVESMAAGKPVIGVDEGGLRETVLPGETGLLLPPEFTVEELRQAVRFLDATTAQDMRAACEERAEAFDAQLFTTRMRALL